MNINDFIHFVGRNKLEGIELTMTDIAIEIVIDGLKIAAIKETDFERVASFAILAKQLEEVKRKADE